MASSQSLYTCRSWTRPIVKSEILTWWYRTYQLVGSPWTSPLASWPHWHLPSLQTPPCADGPENRQRQRVRIWDEAKNKTGNLWLAQFHFQSWAVPALSDRDKCNALCDGRQLPKSPPLNTSQSLWKKLSNAQVIMYLKRMRVLDVVSFAWVCTAAPYRHRLTANPAKLARTRETLSFHGHRHNICNI